MPVIAIEAEADQLYSLHDWLRDVDDLRGRIRLEQRAPLPGHMGAPTSALLVSIDTEPEVRTLARTVEFWLRMRGSDVALKLRVGNRVTELDLRGEVDVEVVVRQVDTLLREALQAATD